MKYENVTIYKMMAAMLDNSVSDDILSRAIIVI